MNNAIIAKRIPGVEPPSLVLVDAFRHQGEKDCHFFLLSHFHADHYQGLTDTWDAGPIYCSEVTARLVVKIIGVDPKFVHPLPFDQEVELTSGVAVTLLDANHCPGASLLLFRVGGGKGKKDGAVYHLHTGDMRYHERMKTYPALQGIRVDTVLLDTTYSHPRYEHMPQEDAMEAAAQAVITTLAQDKEAGNVPRKTLILLSAYKLGKERILLHVSKRTGLPIYVDEDKVRVLSCLGWEEDLLARFTTDPTATPLHVCRMGFCGEMWPYFRPNFNNLQRYLDQHGAPQGYTHIHGIIPTGWADGSNWNRRNAFRDKGSCSVQLIPYSEHSNFPELYEFVSFLRPRCVLPTVFSDDKDRAAIAKRFRHAVDLTANKRAFLSLFGGGGNGKATSGNGGGGIGAREEDADAVAEVQVVEEEDDVARGVKRARNAGDQPVRQAAAADAGGRITECYGGTEAEPLAADATSAEIPTPPQPSSVASSSAAAVGVEGQQEGFACRTCTYMHEGAEAGRADCAMCGTPRSKQQVGEAGRRGKDSTADKQQTSGQPQKQQQRTLLGYLRGSAPAGSAAR